MLTENTLDVLDKKKKGRLFKILHIWHNLLNNKNIIF